MDGIWHWREMCDSPYSYGLTKNDVLLCPELQRSRGDDNDPFSHHTGDEWLAANPVEIPGLQEVLKSCRVSATSAGIAKQSQSPLSTLPSELLDCIFALLDVRGLSAVAGTCRGLRDHAQLPFRQHVNMDLSWLWEISEGRQYPTSPDWPVTWDPCNPPGLVAPQFPPGLESEETEVALWEQITADDPDMRAVGNAVRLVNSVRRETLLNPYRAQKEWSLREWHGFRASVADWIRNSSSNDRQRTESVDWIRLWHSLTPDKTSLLGIRNRARIWKDCVRILDYNTRLRVEGKWEAKQEVVREILSYNREEWWQLVRAMMDESGHSGFMRRRTWE